MKEIKNPKKATILLIILIALGGIILYGTRTPGTVDKAPQPKFQPTIIGPKTPPPGYVQ